MPHRKGAVTSALEGDANQDVADRVQTSSDDSMVEASKQTTASANDATLVNENVAAFLETLKVHSVDKSE